MKKNQKALTVFITVLFLLPFASCSKSKSNSAEENNATAISYEPNPASDFDYELTYELDGVIIKGFVGSNKRVIIVPETIENLPIKSLGYERETIRLGDESTELLDLSRISVKRIFLAGSLGRYSSVKIILPEGVEEIGGFWHSDIKSINIPSSVKVIDHAAFLCSNFDNSDFEIPEGVESIGMNAFSGSNIKSVTIPASIRYIWTGAFLCCDNLETINLPENKDDINYLYNVEINTLNLRFNGNGGFYRYGTIPKEILRAIDDETNTACNYIKSENANLDRIFSGKALESNLEHLKELRTTKLKKYINYVRRNGYEYKSYW